MTNIHDQNWQLNNTTAGAIAKQLDAKDGTQDNKISGSVWNEFVGGLGDGVGKKISEGGSISVFNAMRSITTYAVKAGKAKADEVANNWKTKLGGAAANDDDGTVAPGATEPTEGGEAPAKAGKKTVKQNHTVSDAEMKANIQKDYSSIRVTLRSPNYIGNKPDARAVNTIKKNKASAKKAAQAIIAANNAFGQDNSRANVDKIKAALSQINKDNVIYVLREIPNLAELIDGVDCFGAGLDKDDVYNYVMKPLEQKLGKKTLFSKDDSLTRMASDAARLSANERAKDSNVIKAYNKEVAEYNNSVKDLKNCNAGLKAAAKDAQKAGTVLARAANMPDSIQKFESGKDADGYPWKKATLKDGTVIEAYYDKDGSFDSVYVNCKDGSHVGYGNNLLYRNMGSNYDITQPNIMKNVEAIINKIFK